MSSFMLSFRLERNNTYQVRYDELYALISIHKVKWWLDCSSCIVFESDTSIAELAADIKNVIDPVLDVVLLKDMNVKAARVVGRMKTPILVEIVPYIVVG